MITTEHFESNEVNHLTVNEISVNSPDANVSIAGISRQVDPSFCAPVFECSVSRLSAPATATEATSAAESTDAEPFDGYLPWSRPARYVKRARLDVDCLHAVSSGYVRVVRHLEGGARVGLGIYGAGAVLGEGCLYGAGGDVVEVISSEAWVLSWPAASLELLLHKEGARLAMIRLMGQRAQEINERLDAHQSPIKVRLALVLLRTCRSVGTITNGVYSLPPISHEILGEEVGANREPITGYMGELRKAGAITYSRTTGIQVWPAVLRAAVGLAVSK